MKKVGLLVLGLGLSILYIFNDVRASYEYENDISSDWILSVKASTLEKKLEYLNKFVNKIENLGYEGKYNTIFYKTKNVSFDENLLVLKSLQEKLEEIKDMDVSSFQYQNAMFQITKQEQYNAKSTLKVFNGIWYKTNHILLWKISFILIIIGWMILLKYLVY